MANPNLLNLTSIVASTARNIISTSNITIMTTGSNELRKLVSLYVTNVTTSTVTFSVWTGSSARYIAKDMDLPPDSTLQLISKDAPIYLIETVPLLAVASASNSIHVHVGYETMS